MSAREPRAELVAEVVQRFGSARIRVQGSSMLPTLRPGDEVGLRSASISQIKRGDMIAFQQGERLFVHRVIERCAADKLLTQGDALTQPDVPVSDQQLLGVVESVHAKWKKVGNQKDTCQTPNGGNIEP
jgi:signal peptidase I